MTAFTADGNQGLGLDAHITGGVSAGGNSGSAPSAGMAWVLIIAALVLLTLMGYSLRRVLV
jgi:hypothetical protein